MARLFISYANKDVEAARKLTAALESAGHEIWVDWEDIPPTVDWLEEILKGIEGADVFLFLISPDAVVSAVCQEEIKYAGKNNKRIIPIVLRNIDVKDAHETIRRLNWIFLRDADNFEEGLARIQIAIETDYDWVQEHRRLQLRALEWDRKKDESFLLRGADLQEAESMLASAMSKEPSPTRLQLAYIQASRKTDTRRQRRSLVVVTGLLIIMACVSAAGILQFRQVQILENQLAEANTQLSVAQTQLAQTYVPPATSAIATQPQLVTPAATQVVSATDLPAVPTETSAPSVVAQTLAEIRSNTVAQITVGIVSALTLYFVAMLALVTRATKLGSALFARSWLTKAATKPLLVMPGIGRWALFIGYKDRLNATLKVYLREGYFGVPARDPDGKDIYPDIEKKGETLHNEIIKRLGAQRPVLILGNGGAGKTTLLAQVAHQTIHNQISSDLKGYIPIFITPTYYEGDLLSALADVLRERDGVALTKETLQTQLEAGKYLILFDGISEIKGDQKKGLEEIVSVATNADFGNCRFMITSRPNISIPPGTQVFQLLSLSLEDINGLLSRENLERERKSRVLRQLEIFKSKPIEPMLFSMILEQSKDGEFNATLSALYESYVRRLLTSRSSYSSALEGDRELSLRGWSSIMEEFAHWFFIESGNRGIGIRHEQLVDLIQSKSLLSEVMRYYQLKFDQESHVILQLKDAGILEETRRWRFRHDTFEEYFAAKYIVSHLDEQGTLPDLKQWTKDDVQIQSFSKVVDFMAEMIADDSHLRDLLLNSNLPSAWITLLQET